MNARVGCNVNKSAMTDIDMEAIHEGEYNI